MLVYLDFITNYFLFRAASTDPGIVPGRTWNIKGGMEELPEKYANVSRENRVHYLQRSLVNSPMLFKFKFCDSCYIFRPLRTSHCNICNNCMLKYDHHCVWLGSCVAKRNYNLFYWFVFHLTAMIIEIMVLTVLNVVYDYQEELEIHN